MRKALISQGFSVWHLNRPQHLSVGYEKDVFAFFAGRAELSQYFYFKAVVFEN